MFKNFFKEKEQKNYSQQMSLLQLINGTFGYADNSRAFIKYYVEACPVFTATKLISDTCASIKIVVKDKKKDEFVNHPILDLLKNPNPFTDGDLFIKQLVSYFLLTGNAYINIIGTGKPVELSVFNPSAITIQANSRDGYAGQYTYGNLEQYAVYSRNADKKFFDAKQNELIHLRDFNPNYSSSNLEGSSAFLGCELEISQYVLASIHNNSLLKNQARPSGMLTYKGKQNLSDSELQGVKSILKEQLSGSANAGKTTFLNGEYDWKQLSESVKDMDFPQLKKGVSEAIYSAVKIPLPMISPDNMSFANMDASKFAFYDNAVLPVLGNVLEFLSKNLLPRYRDSENLELTYDSAAIEALEVRKVENALTISKTGALTINEVRAMMGFESVEGGDTIYQPANLLPVGQDRFTADNRDTPAEKAHYIKLMSGMKTMDGKRLYSDDFIKKNLEIYYS